MQNIIEQIFGEYDYDLYKIAEEIVNLRDEKDSLEAKVEELEEKMNSIV
jgi:ubiquinone biosynthesis protein UbiJ